MSENADTAAGSPDVRVTFTRAQADALFHVIHEVIDSPDVMESLFDDGRRRVAAYNAAKRFDAAWAKNRVQHNDGT